MGDENKDRLAPTEGEKAAIREIFPNLNNLKIQAIWQAMHGFVEETGKEEELEATPESVITAFESLKLELGNEEYADVIAGYWETDNPMRDVMLAAKGLKLFDDSILEQPKKITSREKTQEETRNRFADFINYLEDNGALTEESITVEGYIGYLTGVFDDFLKDFEDAERYGAIDWGEFLQQQLPPRRAGAAMGARAETLADYEAGYAPRERTFGVENLKTPEEVSAQEQAQAAAPTLGQVKADRQEEFFALARSSGVLSPTATDDEITNLHRRFVGVLDRAEMREAAGIGVDFSRMVREELTKVIEPLMEEEPEMPITPWQQAQYKREEERRRGALAPGTPEQEMGVPTANQATRQREQMRQAEALEGILSMPPGGFGPGPGVQAGVAQRELMDMAARDRVMLGAVQGTRGYEGMPRTEADAFQAFLEGEYQQAEQQRVARGQEAAAFQQQFPSEGMPRSAMLGAVQGTRGIGNLEYLDPLGVSEGPLLPQEGTRSVAQAAAAAGVPQFQPGQYGSAAAPISHAELIYGKPLTYAGLIEANLGQLREKFAAQQLARQRMQMAETQATFSYRPAPFTRYVQ